MTRRHYGERGMPQLGLAPLGLGEGDAGIELSPDELDRNVERLELGQTLSVLGERIEELRRYLDECRAFLNGNSGFRNAFLSCLGVSKRPQSRTLVPRDPDAQLVALGRPGLASGRQAASPHLTESGI